MATAPPGPTAHPGGAKSSVVPDWVTDAVGSGLTRVARLSWGFTNETWSATTATGERYAITRMASPAAASFVLRNGVEIARRVEAVGLAMPVPDATRSSATDGVVVSSWLDGANAMTLLSEAKGAAAVGRALGEARRRLDDVDIAGLALDDTWAHPPVLAAAAVRWLESIRADIRAETVAVVTRRIETVGALPPAARASFLHGDLVPANLLLRRTGNALLDFEAARIGDPLADAAWFGWIVGYHHPRLLPPAWRGFVEAARLGKNAPAGAELLNAYVVLRIVEILAGPSLTPGARDRWVRQLEAAVGGEASP